MQECEPQLVGKLRACIAATLGSFHHSTRRLVLRGLVAAWGKIARLTHGFANTSHSKMIYENSQCPEVIAEGSFCSCKPKQHN